MRTVPLGKVVLAAGSRARGSEPLPVYSVTKHFGFVPSLEYFKKQVFSRDTAGYKIVEPGDFAYATIHLDEGSIGIAPERCLISPMYTVFSADRARVDPNYLIRFMKSPEALAQYSQLGRGAIHRRKAISLAALGNLPVPLPTVEEQRRIAAILDKADSIRAKRRQVLAHLDALTQSIFHELIAMGPVRTVRLGEVARFIGGASLPEGKPYRGERHGTLLMKVSDMNRAGNEREMQATALWTDARVHAASVAPADSVVLPKRGASIATNKKRLTTRPTLLDPNLMGVHPDPLVLTPAYAFAWFQAFDLASITSGSTVPQLNKQDLAPLRIPLPELDQQHEFSEKLSAVVRQAEVVRLGCQRLDSLFTALQSRAFRGEL